VFTENHCVFASLPNMSLIKAILYLFYYNILVLSIKYDRKPTAKYEKFAVGMLLSFTVCYFTLIAAIFSASGVTYAVQFVE
jgi:hypothetical protein